MFRGSMALSPAATADEAVVKVLPQPVEVIESPHLDLLELIADDQGKIMFFIFFDSGQRSEGGTGELQGDVVRGASVLSHVQAPKNLGAILCIYSSSFCGNVCLALAL